MNARDRLIVALDEPDADAARARVDALGGAARWLKVGMTLYFQAGPAFVRELRDAGYAVFVDLKCHDIPHQVEGAVAALADLGAGLVTVHTAGGPAMMAAAARAAEGTATRVIGVTVLTSLDEADLSAIGFSGTAPDLVLRRARLAREAGLHGVVASPLEAEALRGLLGPEAEIVTPGIRPATASADDQRRVATPAAAVRAGASRLVVGRPIARAADPGAAARAILAEIEAAA